MELKLTLVELARLSSFLNIAKENIHSQDLKDVAEKVEQQIEDVFKALD